MIINLSTDWHRLVKNIGVGQTKILGEEKGCNNWWKYKPLTIIGGTYTGCPHPKREV